ncbi:mitochondrial import receptor subunit TOM20 homolog [Antedon mediterranea]|uniref:mitochondrial import receptor subunit TOM20 homolog n=1 Tax=Antedon mediterranea TaxID=105859 RepID=UPI003AF73A4F
MLIMNSKAAVGLIAGIAGSIFLGYCVYFDRKRRSAPDFRQKLKEKRAQKAKTKPTSKASQQSELPDLQNPEAVQKFFLDEVQLGEELLAQGDFDNGVDHLSNAVAVCGQPQQLLQVLQQTLPPQVFQMLIQKLPGTSQRLAAASAAASASGSSTIAPSLAEDDELE